MAVDYGALLCKKVQAEYDEFLAKLKDMSVEDVMEMSYEKVIKCDLVMCIEEGGLERNQAKVLYKEKYPLDYCYQAWCKNDLSYMDLLRDTVSDSATKAVQNLKEKSNQNR